MLVDAARSVLRRLNQLTDYPQPRLPELYADIVAPAFDDLLLAHYEYLQAHDRVRRQLPPFDALTSVLIDVADLLRDRSAEAAGQSRRYMDIGIFRSLDDAQRYSAEHHIKSTPWTAQPHRQWLVRVPSRLGAPIEVGFSDQELAFEVAAKHGLSSNAVSEASTIAIRPEEIAQLDHLRDEVARIRLEFEPLRTTLHAVAADAAHLELPTDAARFVQSVADYFSAEAFEEERPHDVRLCGDRPAGVIDALDLVLSQANAVDANYASHRVYDIEQLLGRFERNLREQWSHVCVAMVAVKIALAGDFPPASPPVPVKFKLR